MRKLTRSVLRAKAYKYRGGNNMFKYFWKQLRIKQGYKFVEDKPAKPKSAIQRLLDSVFKKGGK